MGHGLYTNTVSLFVFRPMEIIYKRWVINVDIGQSHLHNNIGLSYTKLGPLYINIGSFYTDFGHLYRNIGPAEHAKENHPLT